MNEFENFSPSELIYLFLDGEATDAEKSTLFSAMAHDPELQLEFQEAMRITKSVTSTAPEITPPPVLSQSLFVKAGFNPELIAPLAAGTAAVATESGFLQALAAKVVAAKAVLIPVASTVAGAIITAGVVYKAAEGHFEQKLAQEKAAISRQIPAESTAQLPAAPQENAVPEEITSNQVPAEEPAPRVWSSVPPRNGGEDRAYGNGSAPDRIRSSAHSAAEMPAANVDHTPVETESVNSFAAIETASYGQSEPRYMSVGSARRDYVVEQGAGSGFALPGDGYKPRWEMSTRQIHTMQLFPDRGETQDYRALDNTALSLSYNLSDNFAVSVEMGEENFPLYVMNSKGEFELNNTMQWGAVGFRYSSDRIAMLGNTSLYGQALFGASFNGTGPLAKSIVGAIYQPYPYLSFSAGLEGTVALYTLEGRWNTVQKLGLNYGITLHF